MKEVPLTLIKERLRIIFKAINRDWHLKDKYEKMYIFYFDSTQIVMSASNKYMALTASLNTASVKKAASRLAKQKQN